MGISPWIPLVSMGRTNGVATINSPKKKLSLRIFCRNFDQKSPHPPLTKQRVRSPLFRNYIQNSGILEVRKNLGRASDFGGTGIIVGCLLGLVRGGRGDFWPFFVKKTRIFYFFLGELIVATPLVQKSHFFYYFAFATACLLLCSVSLCDPHFLGGFTHSTMGATNISWLPHERGKIGGNRGRLSAIRPKFRLYFRVVEISTIVTLKVVILTLKVPKRVKFGAGLPGNRAEI